MARKQITNQDLYDIMEKLRKEMKDNYVTKEELAPLTMAYRSISENINWVIRIIVLAVVGAVLKIILIP